MKRSPGSFAYPLPVGQRTDKLQLPDRIAFEPIYLSQQGPAAVLLILPICNPQRPSSEPLATITLRLPHITETILPQPCAYRKCTDCASSETQRSHWYHRPPIASPCVVVRPVRACASQDNCSLSAHVAGPCTAPSGNTETFRQKRARFLPSLPVEAWVLSRSMIARPARAGALPSPCT